MTDNWKNVLIKPDRPIREALKIIDQASLRIALVVDKKLRLLGVVTDGDIRRGLLNNINLENTVSQVMNIYPLTAKIGSSRKDLVNIMIEKQVLAIPLLENSIICGLEVLGKQEVFPRHQNPVFIMAGGFGTRLKPLTDNCPKPLLEVGGKPILEILLLRFIKAGFARFYISTHYLPEMIRRYFGDGAKWNVNITYVYEESPLGTGGALGLLPTDMPDLPLIMVNGDVLTNIDFERLIEFHSRHEPTATMCVRDYEYQVPFGVITGNGIEVISMEEKPIQRFFVNAGIYVVSPEMQRSVAKNQNIDMPSLLERFIERQEKVMMFPVHEYWLDIGRMDDYKRAQTDILSMEL